ncbi:MAG: VIT1/CCC1 transporter family protein [Chloroflexota bacterium]
MPKAAASPEARFKTYLRNELEAAAVYNVLAAKEKDRGRAELFKGLAMVELRHARHWATKLGLEPADLKPKLTFRARLVALLAKRLGTKAALPLVLKGEFAEIRAYAKEPEAGVLTVDERRHAQIVGGLTPNGGGVDVIQSEGRLRVANASNVRAAVLGFSDGLVALFALITGVAGGTSDSQIILLAGVAGLLAGGFSMAAGEYLSVRAQCDVYEREVEIETAEIEESPEQEKEELVFLFQAKGFSLEEAQVASERVLANPEIALNTMAREELGLDPAQMGNPWAVAISSLVAFTLGALIPLSPYFFTTGNLALGISVTGSAVGAPIVGATLSSLSNKNVVWGGIRMLLICAASAGVTYIIGRLMGVTIA